MQQIGSDYKQLEKHFRNRTYSQIKSQFHNLRKKSRLSIAVTNDQDQVKYEKMFEGFESGLW